MGPARVAVCPVAKKVIIQGFSVLYPPRSGLLQSVLQSTDSESERQERP